MAEIKIEIKGLDKSNDRFWVVIDPKDTRYLVPDKTIRPYLELSKTIDANVKLDIQKKSGEGTYNLIQSITVDGQIIGGKTQKGFFPSRARSPEERESIEAQVSIKEIGENWRADKFSDKDKEVETYRLWLIDRLNKSLYGEQSEETKSKTKPDAPEKDIPDSQPALSNKAIATKEAIKAICLKKKWQAVTLQGFIGAKLHIETPFDELNEEQLETLLEHLEKLK